MTTVGQREVLTRQRLMGLFKQFGYDEIAALAARLAKIRQLKQGMIQVLLTDAIRLPLSRAG